MSPGDDLRLLRTPEGHLPILMSWFQTQRLCREWGGPKFRFPFDAATFRADTRFGELPSYSLMSSNDDLLGFGQYYRRHDRCHLARLAIAPGHRGRRLGAELVARLGDVGCAQLRVRDCSLFVLHDNPSAIRLYERVGFAAADYPETTDALAGCVYMVWIRERSSSAAGQTA